MSGRLTITRGLPGSGKTTWANVTRALDEDTTMIVNRDDARLRLFGSCDQDYYACSGESLHRKEKLVTTANHAAIAEGLKAGFHVIVDDTNLPVRTCRELRAIARREGVSFEVEDFSAAHLSLCLQRNSLRKDKAPVPEQVIQNMYDRFIKGGLAPLPEKDDMAAPGEYGVTPVHYTDNDGPTKAAYIVDVDGTLAIHGDRSPYDFSRVHEDEPNYDVVDAVNFLGENTRIIVMSGRSEECRKETADWLRDNEIKFDELHMRPRDDKRADWQVKYDLYNQHVRGKYSVLGVFDDRDQVVKLWREMGLTCFQVNYGAF